MNFTPSNAKAILSSKEQGGKVFKNYLNPVMLVFIGKLSLSTLRADDELGFQ